MPTEEDLRHRFTFHPVKDDEQAQHYESVRGWSRALAIRLNEICPDSRELSLALTKLEEAVFWANASIARNS